MNDLQKARTKALSLLGRRSHSELQLRQKLLRQFAADTVDDVLDWCRSNDWLDDQSFATERAQSLRGTRHWGWNRIRADLMRCGINARIVDRVRVKIRDVESEGDALGWQIQSWTTRNGTPTNVGELQRLYSYCLRQGFHPAETREALDGLWGTIRGQD